MPSRDGSLLVHYPPSSSISGYIGKKMYVAIVLFVVDTAPLWKRKPQSLVI